MAGWQQFVDVHLVGSGGVRKAAICGHDGTVWAKSANFEVKPEEVQRMVAGFKAPESLQMNGVYCEGQKFICNAVEENRIRAKKGSTGLHIVITAQAIIVSFYDGNIQPGQCAKATEAVADYLKQTGY